MLQIPERKKMDLTVSMTNEKKYTARGDDNNRLKAKLRTHGFLEM